MIGYVLRRLAGAIPTLFIIVAVAFFMMRAAPGGPFDGERKLPPEIERNIKAAYDLDKPLVTQFGLYLGRLLTGDFGPSFKNKDFSVGELIAAGAPVSLRLGLSAITIAALIGMALGIIAALNQNRATDFSVMSAAMIGITIPTFVTAPLLTLLLGVYAGWLPVATWNNGALANMILPVTVLALPQIAVISRLTRGSMIEVLRSNFVRTARAKGLSEFTVVTRHALPAALLPLVSYLGPATAALVTGSLVVEQIFQLPGIGRYFVLGALNRDYTLVMGVIILYASLIIALNLIADVLYAVLDPKVRLA
ncbi:MAG: oligopeptide ABC transporter permease OppB [Alphaproteobacteria bacterium]|nr:oligopeptide ABC transporter permease OppB [Alphaproteobacteria bacterium]